jgi:hypothetical protein
MSKLLIMLSSSSCHSVKDDIFYRPVRSHVMGESSTNEAAWPVVPGNIGCEKACQQLLALKS